MKTCNNNISVRKPFATKAKITKCIGVFIFIILALIVCLNLINSLQIQQNTSTAVKEYRHRLYYLTTELDSCYYSGEFSKVRDTRCLNQLSEIRQVIDKLPSIADSRVINLIWSGTHSYLDAKYYPDFNRLATKSFIDGETSTLLPTREQYTEELKHFFNTRKSELKFLLR